jgi:hypothetical protein
MLTTNSTPVLVELTVTKEGQHKYIMSIYVDQKERLAKSPKHQLMAFLHDRIKDKRT